MYKRMTVCFFLLMTLFCVTLMQLYSVSTNEDYKSAQANQSQKTKIISQSRGMIYDCNMNPLVNESFYRTDGIETVRRYSKNQLASHVIGYVNGEGKGVSGIELSFNDVLNKYSGSAYLKYNVDAKGEQIPVSRSKVSYNNYLSKGGIVLTVDGRFQRAAERALSDYGRPSAAVVCETATGKIRAMASYPPLNNAEPSANLGKDGNPFLNRAMSGYNLGSVFKLCVSAAAIEDGADCEKIYNCNGSITIDGNEFSCADSRTHGKENMRVALENSCNTYFINLTRKSDGKKMLDICEKFGFGIQTRLCRGLSGETGSLPSEERLKNNIARASFSFGQDELTATPLQVAGMINAIANDGKRCELVLVEGEADESGNITPYRANPPITAISSVTANMLQDYMISVANDGTGRSGLPKSGGAGAKTATAETGITKDGDNVLITWYAGFIPAYNPKYSIVVMTERGVSGSQTCGPIFKKIADSINDFSEK